MGTKFTNKIRSVSFDVGSERLAHQIGMSWRSGSGRQVTVSGPTVSFTIHPHEPDGKTISAFVNYVRTFKEKP